MNKISFWGLLTVISVVVVLVAVILLPALARAREHCRCGSCQNNLKEMGVIFKMYSNESKGQYPPVSSVPNNWMMSMAAICPEYVSDPNILTCPYSPYSRRPTFTLKDNKEHPAAKIGSFHPDCVTSLFYIYTGYELLRDEQARALDYVRMAQPEWFGRDDIDVTAAKDKDAAQSVSLTRLKDPAGDASHFELVPLMWDRIGVIRKDSNHVPIGGNVLYGDGHVEFRKYSDGNKAEDFPVTRGAAEAFEAKVPQYSGDCQE